MKYLIYLTKIDKIFYKNGEKMANYLNNITSPIYDFYHPELFVSYVS